MITNKPPQKVLYFHDDDELDEILFSVIGDALRQRIKQKIDHGNYRGAAHWCHITEWFITWWDRPTPKESKQ